MIKGKRTRIKRFYRDDSLLALRGVLRQGKVGVKVILRQRPRRVRRSDPHDALDSDPAIVVVEHSTKRLEHYVVDVLSAGYDKKLRRVTRALSSWQRISRLGLLMVVRYVHLNDQKFQCFSRLLLEKIGSKNDLHLSTRYSR